LSKWVWYRRLAAEVTSSALSGSRPAAIKSGPMPYRERDPGGAAGALPRLGCRAGLGSSGGIGFSSTR
jgi:hypothetical protein